MTHAARLPSARDGLGAWRRWWQSGSASPAPALRVPPRDDLSRRLEAIRPRLSQYRRFPPLAPACQAVAGSLESHPGPLPEPDPSLSFPGTTPAAGMSPDLAI